MTRRAGRPPLDPDDPSVPIHVCVPSKKFDELCALARRQDITLAECVRRLIYGRVSEKKNIK